MQSVVCFGAVWRQEDQAEALGTPDRSKGAKAGPSTPRGRRAGLVGPSAAAALGRPASASPEVRGLGQQGVWQAYWQLAACSS
jgi:hypothetical protein